MATFDIRAAESNEIKYYIRDKLKLVITVTDQDDAAVDLSGDTLVFSIRETESGTAVTTISGSDITVSGASNNIVTVSKDISNTLTEKTYYYDLDDTTQNKTIIDGELIASYQGR